MGGGERREFAGNAGQFLKSFHRGLHSAHRPGLFKICPRIEIEHPGAKRSGREEVAIPQSGEKLWKIVQPAHDLVSRDWNRVIKKYAVHLPFSSIVE
jgi:hypothetical protein